MTASVRIVEWYHQEEWTEIWRVKLIEFFSRMESMVLLTWFHFSPKNHAQNFWSSWYFCPLDLLASSLLFAHNQNWKRSPAPHAFYQSIRSWFCAVATLSADFLPNPMNWNGEHLDANRTCHFDDWAFLKTQSGSFFAVADLFFMFVLIKNEITSQNGGPTWRTAANRRKRIVEY